MAQKESIMNQIKKYITLPYKEEEGIDKEIKFWNENGKKIKKIIEGNEFSKGDYQTITKAMDKLYKNHIREERYTLIPDELRDICKAYISLSLKNYEKIDKYLSLFDASSAYYKRIKALSKFWLYEGPIEGLNYLFGDICTLLGEAMELKPEKSKECINIMKQYLETLYSTSLFGNSRRRNVLNYTNSNYWENFLKDEEFREWYDGINEKDERMYHDKGISEIIDEIMNRFTNGRMPSKNEIMNTIEPLMNEYRELEKKIKEQGKIIDDIDKEYEEFLKGDYKKYTPNDEHNADIVMGLGDDLGKDPKYDEFHLKPSLKTAKEGGTVIVQISEAWDDKKKEKVKNQYKKAFGDYKDQLSFWEVPEGKDLGTMVAREGTYQGRLNEAYTKDYYLNEELYDVSSNIIKKVTEICYNSKYGINQNIKKEKKVVTYNEDMKDRDNGIEILNQMYAENEIKQKIISNLEEENGKQLDEIEKLKELLKSNGIEYDDGESQKKRDRSTYKIFVIGGRDDRNNAYKTMIKEGKINKYLKQLGMIPSQLPPKVDMEYDSQHKDTFIKSIKTKLETGNVDFVIAIQTDHETALTELLKIPRYRQRITYFAERDEEGRRLGGDISNKGQNFSHSKFKYYLKIAIDKFENSLEVGNID